MVDAPERIWLSAADSDNECEVWTDASEGGTEYIRADKTGHSRSTRDAIAAFLKVRDENVTPDECDDEERAASADEIIAELATGEVGTDGWAWPKYQSGDKVRARLHNGAIRDGEITGVETHYGWGEPKPHHAYRFHWGKQRDQVLGESKILGLLSARPKGGA